MNFTKEARGGESIYILTVNLNQEKTALESHIRSIDEADKLNEYYRYLDCRCIDMVTINADGYAYDVMGCRFAVISSRTFGLWLNR